MLYFFYMTSAMAFVFQMQCVKAYFFLTTIVRAFASWMQRANAYLPTHGCASTFRTTLISTHAAPNTRQPCVCALDDDGHRISLRVDKCHSIAFSSKLRMSRYVVSGRRPPWHLPTGRRIQRHMPFRHRESGHISSRRPVPRHVVCGRRTPWHVLSRRRVPGHLPTGHSAHVSRYILRTMLDSAHAATNVRQPGVCVLEEDKHHSSLLGDKGQGKWRPDDACPCIFLPDDDSPAQLQYYSSWATRHNRSPWCR